METYCRKLATRLQLLVPTGGKVYKSLIQKKKKIPSHFIPSLSPFPKDCETERAARAWIRSISEFLQSLGSLPPATAALGVWKKGEKKIKRRGVKKKIHIKKSCLFWGMREKACTKQGGGGARLWHSWRHHPFGNQKGLVETPQFWVGILSL